MSRSKLLGFVAMLVLGAVASLAQSTSPVQYFYDDLGRLSQVVDQNGNRAVYHYDAAGNLLSITRTTVPANNGLSILNFNPQQGPSGISVTIQGQGFGATPSANTVQFNGVNATVTAATGNSLTVTVPTGATTGPISVTVAGTTASSDTSFTVVAATLMSIAVSPVAPVIAGGATQQFTATGTYNNGTTQDLTTSVTWSSSNASFATISNSAGSQGLAAGAGGAVVIKATSGSITGYASLTVRSVATIAVSPSALSVYGGATQQFTVLVTYVDGTVSYGTASATWSSSNPAVAAISNAPGSQGLAKALSNGATTITASLQSASSSVSLNVVTPVSLTVTPANASLGTGESGQFIATSTNSDGSTSDLTKTATWSSSDPTVVLVGNTVGNYGLARAAGIGTATITATITPASGAISGSTTVTTTGPVPTSITVTPAPGFAPVGGTQKFAATATMSDGTSLDVTPLATWTSSDTTIATVGNPEGSEEFATGVAVGTATITASYSGSWGTLSNAANVVVANSVVAGAVIFSDGTPVPFPDVFVSQTDSQGNVHTFFTNSTDANGNYWVTNIGLGAFTVIAQDPTSGLNTSVNATLVTTSETATVNVQLPPGGIVSGIVTDSTGATLPFAFVQVFSTGSVLSPADSPFAVNLTTTTDGSGNYSMSQVSLGEVVAIANHANSGGVVFLNSPHPYEIAMAVFLPSLFASPLPPPLGGAGVCGFPCSAYVGARVGTLSAGGQTLTINVTLPATSTIAGTVYASDGVTPVPNAPIIAIENAGIAGGLADFYTNAYFVDSSFSADGSGNFQLNGLPVGLVNVAAASTDLTSAGVATVPLTTSPTTANVVLGNAFSFMNGEYDLTDPAGPIYDVYCDGTVIGGSAGGNNFVHGAAEQLFVNQQPNFCESSEYGTLDQAGQQITIGPGPRPEGPINVMLQIQRKVYMPASGGYARYLDSFTNPLDVPITTNVLIEDGFDASARPETLLVNPSSNGNSFAILDNTANTASPVFGFVFAGASPSAPVAFFDHSANAAPTVTYQLNQTPGPEFGGGVTIPAHGTVTFMHFIIQRANQDVAGATSLAQSLVNMTDPNEFTGMSAQDKSQVVNFNVP